MRTIGSVLEKHKGIGPGFDFLRIFLALCVLLTHSFYIVQGDQKQFSYPPFRLLHDTMLPMFFALSGFLITGSASRLKLRDFLINRGIRIFPSLIIIVLLSALIIGPIFTTLSLTTYFHDHNFFLYFTNVFGWMRYDLPGVFTNNPTEGIINGSLWTIPFEIICYVITSIFVLTRLLKRKLLALVLTFILAICVAIGFSLNFFQYDTIQLQSTSPPNKLLHYLAQARGVELYIYFLVGSLFYLYRYEIRFSPFIFVIASIAFLLCVFNYFNFIPIYAQSFILYPAIVYITIFIGLIKIPPIPIYKNGDYSYGVYLYGYPLQQALVILLPAMRSPLLHFAISILFTSIIAMISWHLIEKPILSFRRRFSFTARKGDHSISLPTPTADR